MLRCINSTPVKVFLGEPFRPRDVLGALLAGGGAAVVAVWAPSNALEMTNDELLHKVILQWRAMYLLGVAVVGLILCVPSHPPHLCGCMCVYVHVCVCVPVAWATA